MKRFPKTLGLIILIALILRGLLIVVAFQHPERSFTPDTESYLKPALAMLQNGGQYTTESAIRTPLYPMFIALIYWLFGLYPVGVVTVQVLISLMTILLTYYLGVQLLPRNAAFVGAFLSSISIELIVYSFYIVTETLFTFLLMISLLSFTIYITEGRLFWHAISAVLMAFAILCRPIIMFFPIVLLFLIFMFSKKRFSSQILAGLFYIGLVGAILFPWILRNVFLMGMPTISTISDLSLLYYNAVSLEANLQGRGEAEVRDEMDRRVEEKLAELGWQNGEANRARVHKMLARQIILAHPVRYIFLHVKSDLNNLLPSVTEITEILGITTGGKGTASVLNQYGAVAAVKHYFGDHVWIIWLLTPIILLLLLIYFGNLFAISLLIKKRQWLALTMLLLPVMYLLLLPGAPSLPRFRVPAMPFLTLLAGFGLCHTVNGLKKWIKRMPTPSQL